MADIIELLIKASTQYDGGLNKIPDALKSISNATGLSTQQLKALEAEFTRLTAQGLNFKQVIQSISASGNNFGAGVGAAAKQIQTSLNQAAQAAQNLTTQTRNAQQAMTGLQNVAANPLQAIASSATLAAAALGPVGLAIAGVVTVATLGSKALFDLVDAQGAAAQATVNMAAQLGISAGEMKRLEVEGRLIGVSFQSMQIAARQLAVAIEEPTGAGKLAAQTLRDLGVATQTASGAMRQEGAVFNDAVESLSNIEDHTKRTEEATRLFGSRSSAAILLLINRYHELDETARSLGYGDTTKLQEELAKGEEKINAMSAAWDLFKSKLAEKLEPIVVPAVVSLTWLLKEEKGPRRAYGQSDARQPSSFENLNQRRDRESLEDFMLGARASKNETAGGAAEGQRVAAQDLAAGAAATKRSLDSFGGSLEGLEAKLKQISKQIGDDRDKQSRGGLGEIEGPRLAAEVSQLQTQKQSLEANIALIKQTESYFKRLTERVTAEARYPGLDREGLVKFQAERAQGLDLAGGSTSRAGLVNTGYQQETSKYFDNLIGKEQSEAGKKLRESTDRLAKERDKLFDTYLRENDKLTDQLALLGVERQDRIDKIHAASDKSALALQRQRVLGFAKLQSGGENSVTAQMEGSFQISAVSADATGRAHELDALITQLKGQADQTFEVAKKISDLEIEKLSTSQKAEEEIAKLRLDTELKVAELRQKELDSYKQEAGQIFDAIRQPGGRGLQQWFRGQANDLARGVFSNATAPVLQSIGQSLGGLTQGAPAGVQALFKGTILDSARAKSPQIVAQDKNTAALNALTSALTGQSVGGDSAGSITPAPGSIAGNAAASASGSFGIDPLTGTRYPTFGGSSSGGSASSPSGFAQFLKGVTGGIGNWDEIFHPDATDAAGNTYSTADRFGAGVGTLATAGVGIYEGVNQFSKGGASSIAGGIGALSGTAAALDPEPISKGILTGVSLISELFKGLLPDPKTIREAQIANQEQYSTYVAPPTLNRSLSASGGFEQVNNKYGLPSATTFSSVAIEAPIKYQSPIKDPSGLYQNWETAPGQVLEPYQQPAAQPGFITSQAPAPASATYITVHAIDAQSFLDARNKIASAVQMAVTEGHPAGAALQRAVLGT